MIRITHDALHLRIKPILQRPDLSIVHHAALQVPTQRFHAPPRGVLVGFDHQVQQCHDAVDVDRRLSVAIIIRNSAENDEVSR